jgi:hypothetical protein
LSSFFISFRSFRLSSFSFLYFLSSYLFTRPFFCPFCHSVANPILID